MELALYFQNIQQLEQMDEALRPIDISKIPSFLSSVFFASNPNYMEYTVNLASLEWIQKLQSRNLDFSRLYFGEEFCQNLIPEPDDVMQAYYTSRQLGWSFTYVTGGYQTEAGLEKIKANLDKLREIEAEYQVVVNDWGVINVIQTRYPELKGKMVLGRILNKQTRLNLFSRPWPQLPICRDKIKTPMEQIGKMQIESYKDINISNPNYLPILKKWGIGHIDMDMTPQGLNRPKDGWGMSLGYYFPWNFISTARNCPTAGMYDPKRAVVMTDKPCGKPCRKFNCTRHMLQFEQTIIQRGPTLFSSSDDYFGQYFTGGMVYERLIYEPWLPL